MKKGLKIGVVGLKFGGEFVDIYRKHPDVEDVYICEKDAALLHAYGEMFGYDRRYESYEELLQSDVDAIHVVTGIPSHYELVMKALQAGKHCACTVPMGVTLEQLWDIIREVRRSGKKYMMMETSIYTFQCLYLKKRMERGELGKIQYMRGIHFQDMEAWPDYWMGLPPMHYATHAVAPLLYLSGGIPERVVCRGSGKMRKELHKNYGNPYPVETATVTFRGEPYVADITRSLFETAHEYVEGFTILGDQASFEWNVENEPPRMCEFTDRVDMTNMGARGRSMHCYSAQCPDENRVLPEPIREFTHRCTILDPHNPHHSVEQGGSHHGSHPYMVHEFVRSIVEDREPEVDAVKAAFWTGLGICAHMSAMEGGKEMEIPAFDRLWK